MKITARCLSCKKLFVLSDEQVREAGTTGVPWSECCNAIAIVEKVEGRRES